MFESKSKTGEASASPIFSLRDSGKQSQRKAIEPDGSGRVEPLKENRSLYRELYRTLEDDGWYIARTNGSHKIYEHPTKPGTLPVPGHKAGDDVPVGMKRAILKQAGLR